MIEVIDPIDCAPVGYTFSDEEAETFVFALDLYAGQLRNGNYPVPEGSELDAQTVLEATGELTAQINDGSRAIDTRIHAALTQVYLPYLWRMHSGLSADMYQGVCDALEVKPFDLFSHAINARRILDETGTTLQLQHWLRD